MLQSGIPEFVPATWADWLTSVGKNTGDKSFKFLKEGIIFYVYIVKLSDSPVYSVKSRLYRSLRKNEEPHHMHLLASKKDKSVVVDRAHCSCIGRCGGHCNHTFALLFLLNYFSSSKIKYIPSDSACTNKPQT